MIRIAIKTDMASWSIVVQFNQLCTTREPTIIHGEGYLIDGRVFFCV